MVTDMSSVKMKREGIDVYSSVQRIIKGPGEIRVTLSVGCKQAHGNREDEDEEGRSLSPFAEGDELAQMPCAATGGSIGKKGPGAFKKSAPLCLDPEPSGKGLCVKIETSVRRGDFRFEGTQGAQGTLLTLQKSLSQGTVKGRVDDDPAAGTKGGDDIPGCFPPIFFSRPQQKAVSLCEEFSEPAGVMEVGRMVVPVDAHPDGEPVGT